MKRFIFLGVLLCLILGGCQLPTAISPKAGAPPTFPQLSIQQIPRDFKPLTREQQLERLHDLVEFREHLDRYLDVAHKTILKEDYLTSEEWARLCHPTSFFKEINIPPKPNIRDDGSLSDDEIIRKLVNRVKELVNSMRLHNEDFRSALKRFNETCRYNDLLNR